MTADDTNTGPDLPSALPRWWSSTVLFLVGSALSSSSAVFVSLILRGHEIHFIGAIFFAFPLALLILVVGLIGAGVRTRHPHASRPLAYGIVGLGFGLLAHVLALFYPYQYWREQLAEAQSYSEMLVPMLDDYYAKNGEFPTGIDELGEVPPAPPAFEKYVRYDCNEDRSQFEFFCHEPGNLIEFYTYRSEDRVWDYSDY